MYYSPPLYQLSYREIEWLPSMRIELTTLGLLDPRSNQLSYEGLLELTSNRLINRIVSYFSLLAHPAHPIQRSKHTTSNHWNELAFAKRLRWKPLMFIQLQLFKVIGTFIGVISISSVPRYPVRNGKRSLFSRTGRLSR
jgi:hypothetical protein